MKKYGIILADNGSDWYISGVPDERWDNDILRELRNVTGDQFEAVDVSLLMAQPDSAQIKRRLSDVIAQLQILVGIVAAKPGCDATGDGRGGLQEAIFGLQQIGGMR